MMGSSMIFRCDLKREIRMLARGWHSPQMESVPSLLRSGIDLNREDTHQHHQLSWHGLDYVASAAL